jgi:intracellular septation protein
MRCLTGDYDAPKPMSYTARPMKILLDYLPIILFVGAYYLRDIFFATAVLIVALLAHVALVWGMTRRVPKMQLVAALLALGLGGITLALHDPVFIKVKPTVLYGIIAAVLLANHFVGEKLLIKTLFSQLHLNMPEVVWRRLNLMWAGFFIFCSMLNLYVAYKFAEATWVNFKLFGMFALFFVFLLLQGLFLSRYLDTES